MFLWSNILFEKNIKQQARSYHKNELVKKSGEDNAEFILAEEDGQHQEKLDEISNNKTTLDFWLIWGVTPWYLAYETRTLVDENGGHPLQNPLPDKASVPQSGICGDSS